MLDADMDNVGATVITPISNDYCTNNQTSKCKGFNNINCTNSIGACKGATNVQKCMDMSEAVNLPGCG